MENLFVFLATSLVLRIATPRFRRFLVCPGCSTLLNSANKTLQVRYTKDGDKLFFNEHAVDGITYGLVCVQMRQPVDEAKTERLLLNFVHRVRKPLMIDVNTGMEAEEENGVLTVTDYWQDKANFDWKVKGYCNGKVVAFLYVKNVTDTAVKNHDAYLNGFRFSGRS